MHDVFSIVNALGPAIYWLRFNIVASQSTRRSAHSQIDSIETACQINDAQIQSNYKENIVGACDVNISI